MGEEDAHSDNHPKAEGQLEVVIKVLCQCDHTSSHLLSPGLMAPRPSTESANTKVLRRAALKIDIYMITITGMICVSSHPRPISTFWPRSWRSSPL